MPPSCPSQGLRRGNCPTHDRPAGDLGPWGAQSFQCRPARWKARRTMAAKCPFSKPEAIRPSQNLRPLVCWSARCFVDSGEKPEFIRTCEAKSVLCRLRKFSKEFRAHIIAEVFEGVSPDHEWWRTSYTLEPANCGSALGEDMAEAASRPRYGGSVVGSDGGTSSAYRPRLGEATTEGSSSEIKRRPSCVQEPPGSSEEYVYIPPRMEATIWCM